MSEEQGPAESGEDGAPPSMASNSVPLVIESEIIDEREGELDSATLREARYLLWRATGDVTHLAAAKRLLDEALGRVPAALHESMSTGILLHREILTACEEHGL